MFLRPEQFINIKENSHFSYYSSVWQSTFEFGGEEKRESILLCRQLLHKWCWGEVPSLLCFSSGCLVEEVLLNSLFSQPIPHSVASWKWG